MYVGLIIKKCPNGTQLNEQILIENPHPNKGWREFILSDPIDKGIKTG